MELMAWKHMLYLSLKRSHIVMIHLIASNGQKRGVSLHKRRLLCSWDVPKQQDKGVGEKHKEIGNRENLSLHSMLE